MAYVAVDNDGDEIIFEFPPKRSHNHVDWMGGGGSVYLPEGSIEKLTGKTLTWDDEPIELT